MAETALSPHPAITTALTLQPELSSRASEMDNARRLPSDLAITMAKAGMFRAITPVSLGGMECSPAVFMQMLETLARANASASWCAMIACTSTLAAAHLPPDVATKIFSDPEMIAAGIFAPMGQAVIDGNDYILTGRWPWGSGSDNSDWVGLGARVEGEKAPRMLFMPTADVKLLDTWHVAGLRGTGSGDIVAENIRIPKSYSIPSLFNVPVETGPLYTFPPFGLLGIGVASVALGNAQGALEDFYKLAEGKKNQGSVKTLGQRASVQSRYAKAQAQIKAARAYMVDEIAQTWEEAQEQGIQSVERRTALRLACTHMTRTTADICRMLYDMGGGTVLFENSPIQRRFRDAHAITQHIVTAPATYELFGRVLFNQPTNASMI